jgi:hypothetical protein
MKVEQKDNFTIIKDTQGDLVSFLMKLTHEFKTFENKNLIIDISSYKNLTIAALNAFLPLSNQQKKAKKSFVIVVNDFDFNTVSSKLVVVPSKLEAVDIIEMDEIERDLGF